MHADLLANLDLIRLAAAALLVGLVAASARGFLGKLHAIVYIAVTAVIINSHNWHQIYLAMAYGAVSSVLLISARRRPARA